MVNPAEPAMRAYRPIPAADRAPWPLGSCRDPVEERAEHCHTNNWRGLTPPGCGVTIEVRNVGGVFRLDERLYVDGRDRSKLVEGVLGQIEVVRRALADTTTGTAINLAVPNGETDRFPDQNIDWVLFTAIDANEHVVDAGGRLL